MKVRVEMTSTGEVACIGNNKYNTYLNAIISSGIKIPKLKPNVALQFMKN